MRGGTDAIEGFDQWEQISSSKPGAIGLSGLFLWPEVANMMSAETHKSTVEKPPSYTYIAKLKRCSGLLSWAQKGFLAILDQALFSGANFLVNILLARWLMLEEYGAFSVALSIYYLLLNFHTAVLTEPMMVFGAGKYREQFRKYLGMVLLGHWGLSAFLSFGLGMVGFVSLYKGWINLFQALIGLSIAFPFFALQWISRRSAYVIFRPLQATVSSGVYSITVIIFLWILFQAKKLSVLTSILALGVSGLLSSLLILHLIKPHWKWWNYQGNPAPDIVVNDHWIYGRWAIGTVFLMWFPGNIAYILLPAWWGLEASAAVRALMNLVLPIQHAIAALGALALPVLSSSFYNKKSRFINLLKRFLATFVLSSSLYGVFLILLKKYITFFLYGNKYLFAEWLIIMLAVQTITVAVTTVTGSALRSMGRTDLVFKSYVFTTLVTLTIGVLLVRNFGISGAVTSMVFSSLTTAITTILFLYKVLQKNLHEGGE